ncbi:hypothetical protein P154DRAFT_524559, partial [Amniculicola lignicola CBS 123094]
MFTHRTEHTPRRIPEEKGPFGKARKRGSSRQRTPQITKKEDQVKLDNLRVIDSIFNRPNAPQDEQQNKESMRGRKPSGPSSSLPASASAPNLGMDAGLGASFQAGASAGAQSKEPTEVMLYGYGREAQWAAIAHFEKVSGGIIYEDYDRVPPTSKYNLTLSLQKAASYRALSKTAIRKINDYVGGDHWIKVTFDSPEAAERACHYSPHIIQTYTVFAERYRGTGPAQDKAFRASAGAHLSQAASPNTNSSNTLPFGASPSSHTASSATATTSRGPSIPRQASEPLFPNPFDSPSPPRRLSLVHKGPLNPRPSDSTAVRQPPTSTSTSTGLRSQPAPPTGRSTLRVRGAKPAVLLPPEKAFLPAAPRWQQTLGSWPVLGWIVGADHGMIGDRVPRKEDGSFDGEKASLYWRGWYAVDCCLGTDFCGVREAEYD